MRPARTLRPSSVSLVLGPRRVCRRFVSHQHANRSIAQLLQWRPTGQADNVVVNGFVRSVRAMKARRFVALGDGSSLAPLQALVPADTAEGYALYRQMRVSAVPVADAVSAAWPWAQLSASPARGWPHPEQPRAMSCM